MAESFKEMFSKLNQENNTKLQEQHSKDVIIQEQIKSLRKRTDVIERSLLLPVLDSLRSSLSEIPEAMMEISKSDISHISGFNFNLSSLLSFKLGQKLAVTFNIKEDKLDAHISDANQSSNNWRKTYDLAKKMPEVADVEGELSKGLQKVIAALHSPIF